MAKDDYFVIVAKILAFLYQRLKGKEKRGIEYIQADTQDFPISEEYMEYVLRHMHEADLIEGVITRTTPDGFILDLWLDNDTTNITPKGITYLRENSMICRAMKTIPTLASLVGTVL